MILNRFGISPERPRRGVVLVVVIAMLGLLAVIGVTFATYSNQAQIASRRLVANTKANVDPDSLLSYAMEQLINDTNNSLSSLRGHSLKRDMYGNDSVFHGLVTSVPDLTNANIFPQPQVPPMIRSVSGVLFQDPVTGRNLSSPAVLVQTNIPVTGTPFDGYDFTRWVMKLSACSGFDAQGHPLNQNPLFLNQTVEVLNGAWVPALQAGGYRALLIAQPDLTPGLAQASQGVFFSLDGRFQRSFNGAGVTFTAIPGSTVVHDWGKYPNLRLNAASAIPNPLTGEFLPSGMPTNPDNPLNPGYDEDYDAADLENWFLALQSADGSITLPSFHRPGTIFYDFSQQSTNPAWYLANNDWQARPPAVPNPALMANYAGSAAKFLRPRAADGHDRATFPDIVPDMRLTLANGTVPNPTYGQMGYFETDSTGIPAGLPDMWKFHPGYDVDNDGDGYNDSVWIDLGFPVQTDPNGKKYKPLFAFMVVGLNGRLPLNTAGNLHDRSIGVDLLDRDFGPPTVSTSLPGTPEYNHASHLGTSPTEVNPKFALRHSKNPMANYATLEADSLLGLRGLLAGSHVAGTTEPVLGRWGDERILQQFINANPGADIRAFLANNPNPVRAGKSIYKGSMPSYVSPDTADDDGDVFDFLASAPAGPLLPTSPQVYSNERGDGTYPTTSRNLMLGVERQRRFVTPTDPMGLGRVVAWNRQPLFYPNFLLSYVTSQALPQATYDFIAAQLGAVSWYGKGADSRGRVGFFGYYRPPGVSTPEILPPSDTTQTSVSIALNQLVIGTNTYNQPGSFLNTVHGYESYRNPLLGFETEAGNFNGGGFGAAMPYNFGNNWENGTWPNNVPAVIPYPFTNMMTVPSNDVNKIPQTAWPTPLQRGTFTTDIASDINTFSNFTPGVVSPGGMMNLDEADEQNLYDTSDQFDSPFRGTDLADFYLKDTAYDDANTGTSITSRIAQLAPESLGFVAVPQPVSNTGQTLEQQIYNRWPVNPRKLFSHESWDTNRFSWANDNPGGVFGLPGSVMGNANFTANQSASLPNLSNNAAGDYYHFPTPSVASGGRRINLNFPLPAYDYQAPPTVVRHLEPTRLKWLRETYQMMLRVLPPKAVDTGLEKAQLAQYLVNLIDFRDPDGVMTLFTAIDPNTGAVGHGLYETIATPGQPSQVVEGVPPLYAAPANSKPLELWGMEYQPVALNEVLAYEFKYWGNDGKGTEASQRRLFIELVNTLTSSNLNNGAVGQWDPSDQNMLGWEFIVAQDTDQTGNPDATGRPSPITGQIPTDASGVPLGKVGTGSSTIVPVSGNVGSPLPNGKEVKAIRWNAGSTSSFPVYTVLANSQDPLGVEKQSPDTYVKNNQNAVYYQSSSYDQLLPAVGQVTDTEKGRYFWLYLRRPADPADLTSPKVVVDSIRFPYMVSNGTSDANPMQPKITQSTTRLYSAQRIQPYRGGHAISNTGNTPYFPLNAYGYSEQTTTTDDSDRDDQNSHNIGYGSATTQGSSSNSLVSDGRLRHTIGTDNSATEDWQYLPFNDRDFQSVAELLLVPGCGPGQFTKLFVENNPVFGKGQRNPAPATKPSDNPPSRNSTSGGSNFGADAGDALRPTPPTFPYLVDRFYYTGAPQLDYLTPLSTVKDQTGANLTITVPPVLVPGPTGQLYGSPSADGWHKMLEFFEVPSSMNGAIGPVTEGENGDWFRQMRVPGKLNLNLIVDEEVFMGLIDDARVNLKSVHTIADQTDPTTDFVPSIAVGQTFDTVQKLFSPVPLQYSNMANRGYVADPTNQNFSTPAPMKRAFSDFLKLRHGGSGTLLGFGNGQTGYPNARELPFRSLSFPDINYTIMRPGALTPAADLTQNDHPSGNSTPGFFKGTNGVSSPPSTISRLMNVGLDPKFWFVHNYQINTTTDPNLLTLMPPSTGVFYNPPYLGNPGIRNMMLDYSPTFAYAQPPVVPFRRLLQIPDAYLGYNGTNTDWDRNSNANLFGNPFVNSTIIHYGLSTSNMLINMSGYALSDMNNPAQFVYAPASLITARDNNPQNQVATTAAQINFGQLGQPQDPTFLPRPLLGSNLYQVPTAGPMGVSYRTEPDRRQHPFFRTELLQKLMNLTTVRTNQFAVYLTVGFFEVKTEGNPNTLQPDIMGKEIDQNNRYVLFSVVDRTFAEGFNPINPGNYTHLIEYSRRLK